MTQKLLLADDSVTIQRVIELTFADEDMTVVSVGDGQQAIDRIPRERPDIVLVDVDMPQRSGYDVTEFVKSDPALAHIPVLLLTGAFEPVDEARARAVGCDGVLAKPFEPQMLIARVKELLAAGSRGGRPARPAPPVVASPEAREIDILPAVGAGEPGVVLEPEPEPEIFVPLDAAGAETATGGMALDEYFDRLDAAFANLTGGFDQGQPPDAAVPAVPEADARQVTPPGVSWPEAGGGAEPRVDVDLSAWIQPRPPGADEPDVARSLEPEAFEPASVAAGDTGLPGPEPKSGDLASAIETATPGAGPPGAAAELPAGVPGLGTVFSAFLSAEHGVPLPADLTAGLAPWTPLDDEVLEDVTRRVLARFSTQALHETVTDVVSKVAERVVREEIDRLKATLR